MPGLEPRTRAMLVERGVLTEAGLTAVAKYRHCRRCGLLLLAAHWLGLEAWCDPWPLTPRGELDAVMAGRPTFTRMPISEGLRPRDAYEIRARSPLTHDVHSEHRCGQPQPEIAWGRVPAPKPAPDPNAPIPF